VIPSSGPTTKTDHGLLHVKKAMTRKVNPPYAGPVTFLGIDPGPREGARFSVVGVPWDGAVSNRPGQRFGPRNIRLASTMLTQEEHPLFLTAPHAVTQDLGDILLEQHSYSAHQHLEKELKAVLVEQGLINRNVEPIILGGDHSITLPILRTLKPVVGAPLALLHLDAHHDNWSNVFDEHISHGTWLHRALSDNLVEAELICQLGVRSPSNPKHNQDLAKKGAMVLTARELMKKDPGAVATAIYNRIGNTPVWFTLDIDCLDPAFAPAVGTPEVGGLSTIWLLEFIENLRQLNFVGMDVVEVSDNDVNQITGLAAATAVWTYMAMRMK